MDPFQLDLDPFDPNNVIALPSGTAPQEGQNYRYPEKLTQPPFDKWVSFRAMSGRHVLRNNIVKGEDNRPDRILNSVGLHLAPSVLKSVQEIHYDRNDLGPFVGAAVDRFAQSGNLLMGAKPSSDFMGWTATLLQSLTSDAGSLLDSSGLKETFFSAMKANLAAGIEKEFADFGTDPKLGLGALTGKLPNPRTDLLFNTQDYRTYRFEFHLIPHNVREAIQIDNIIRFFQYYSLPQYEDKVSANNKAYDGFMMGFPYEFTIVIMALFKEIPHVNQIARCVLTQVEVDHAPSGKSAFVKYGQDFYPVATALSLSFQEVQLMARDSKEILRGQTLADIKAQESK
jgi:hypothetical protein